MASMSAGETFILLGFNRSLSILDWRLPLPFGSLGRIYPRRWLWNWISTIWHGVFPSTRHGSGAGVGRSSMGSGHGYRCSDQSSDGTGPGVVSSLSSRHYQILVAGPCSTQVRSIPVVPLCTQPMEACQAMIRSIAVPPTLHPSRQVLLPLSARSGQRHWRQDHGGAVSNGGRMMTKR